MQAPCQATITKEGERRPCRLWPLRGQRFCAGHQDLPAPAVARLWWCFRVHGWAMFSPSFAPRVKRLARDLPVSLGRADRDMLRLLETLRRWTDRRDLQRAIEQAARLTRVSLWPGQLHTLGRRKRVPRPRVAVPPKTTLGGTYPGGARLSPLPLSPNLHPKFSTPSPALLARKSAQGLQGALIKGGVRLHHG